MDKDSWNSSASGGQLPISAKSFHAGVSVTNHDPSPGVLASLTSLVTSTNGVINHGSSARLVSRDKKKSTQNKDESVCNVLRQNFIKSGNGGMAMSLMAHFGGAHQQYLFRRPDWLAQMNGSTLTDASSLAFEDNDYQWCSEYAR